MNVKNFDYLKEGLKYLGFGEKLNADLENKIKEQPAEFKLNLVGEFNKDKVTYTLDFRKSDQTDMYFLNRYHATLKNEDPSKDVSQTFYITKNAGISTKEAYNLLSGRAVNKDLTNKEGQSFNAWLQLDFKEKDNNENFKIKQYHQGYGYDLDAVLKRYPIKELGTEEDKAKLVKSLTKGNLQQVTFVTDGKEEKMYISANPQYKNLDLYDANMQRKYQSNEKKEKQEPDKSQEKKESVKQDVDDEGETKKGRRARRGVRV